MPALVGRTRSMNWNCSLPAERKLMAAAPCCAYKKRKATRGGASALCLELAIELGQYMSRLPAVGPPTRMSAQWPPKHQSRAMQRSEAVQPKPIPTLYGNISEY
jgi:hypothetical protein